MIEARLCAPTGNALMIATHERKIPVQCLDFVIRHMPVAIEPRRFCEHKMYHIVLQEVRKQFFGSHSSDS